MRPTPIPTPNRLDHRTPDRHRLRTSHLGRVQWTRRYLQRAWKDLTAGRLGAAEGGLLSARDNHRSAGRALNRATAGERRGDWRGDQEEVLRHLAIELDELTEHIRVAYRAGT